MTHDKTGGAAFPRMSDRFARDAEGMTLRDYFAAKAMSAFICKGLVGAPIIAGWAYEQADAMLATRGDADE